MEFRGNMSDWVRCWIADYQSRIFPGHQAPSKSLSDRLYQAVLSGDVDTAHAVNCEASSGKTWAAVICSVVERVSLGFKNGQVDVPRAASAFMMIEQLCVHRDRIEDCSTATKGRLLVATPDSESHSFGVHILRDHLNGHGFAIDTLLQASQDRLMNKLASESYDALAISVGHDASLLGLADLISAARIASKVARLRVFVGGQVFNGDTTEYEFLGADLIAGPNDDSLAALETYLVAPRLV